MALPYIIVGVVVVGCAAIAVFTVRAYLTRDKSLDGLTREQIRARKETAALEKGYQEYLRKQADDDLPPTHTAN